jgi:hypothetical protein
MIPKIFRTSILLAVSGLFVSSAWSHAQTTNTTPSAKQQPNPKPPAQAPTVQVPQEFKAGIASLVSAKASLEKAGDKWGGHSANAITMIDHALKACGQTQTHVTGIRKSGPGDEDDMASMEAGTTELTNAQTVFKNSNNKWGGRRDHALQLIDQALQQLQAAVDFEKSNNATQKRRK